MRFACTARRASVAGCQWPWLRPGSKLALPDASGHRHLLLRWFQGRAGSPGRHPSSCSCHRPSVPMGSRSCPASPRERSPPGDSGDDSLRSRVVGRRARPAPLSPYSWLAYSHLRHLVPCFRVFTCWSGCRVSLCGQQRCRAVAALWQDGVLSSEVARPPWGRRALMVCHHHTRRVRRPARADGPAVAFDSVVATVIGLP